MLFDSWSRFTKMLATWSGKLARRPGHFRDRKKRSFRAEVELLENRVVLTQLPPQILEANKTSAGLSGGLVTINGTSYFAAADDINGIELWRTDGTGPGTTLVRDINPGGDDSSPSNLTNVSGACSSRPATAPAATSCGKAMALRPAPPSSRHRPGSTARRPRADERRRHAVLRGQSTARGDELWKSDGSGPGTTRLKDIFPGSTSPPSGGPDERQWDAILPSPATAAPAWGCGRATAASAGTTRFKDIFPGGRSLPPGLINVSGTLFFRASDGTAALSCGRATAASPGTIRVKDINRGLHPSCRT